MRKLEHEKDPIDELDETALANLKTLVTAMKSAWERSERSFTSETLDGTMKTQEELSAFCEEHGINYNDAMDRL